VALIADGADPGTFLNPDGDFIEDTGDPGTFDIAGGEVVADTRPGYVEWPLGVFLLSTPKRTLSERGIVTREVKAYDQLVVLNQDKIGDRYVVNAGAYYTEAIADLIAPLGLTAAITASDLTLPGAREWEPGTTLLRILNDLLAAINYESAWFDESGRLICRPYLSPADRSSEYTYADDRYSMRTGSAGQTLDLFDIPNQWVLVKSEGDEPPLVSVYTNDDPSSRTSTAARGRTIVDYREGEDAADQETLDAKARRYAFNASQVFETIEIETAVMPMHSNADVLSLEIPALGIDGQKFSEQSWAFELRRGARMTHNVRRVVTV
jgi:hypothetical protein